MDGSIILNHLHLLRPLGYGHNVILNAEEIGCKADWSAEDSIFCISPWQSYCMSFHVGDNAYGRFDLGLRSPAVRRRIEAGTPAGALLVLL